MITQYDASTILKTAIPGIAIKNYPPSISLEIYATMIYFTDHTKQALIEHNVEEAKKCFQLAEKLYVNGDSIVRLLIEDSFIYTVFSVIAHGSRNMFLIKSILPVVLYEIYEKHLSASHW